MTNCPQASLDRLRYRIGESDEMTEDDREVLQDFDQQLSLLKAEYSTQRQEKLLHHCTIIAEEVGGLADSLTDRGAAEDILTVDHPDAVASPEVLADLRIGLSFEEPEVKEKLVWPSCMTVREPSVCPPRRPCCRITLRGVWIASLVFLLSVVASLWIAECVEPNYLGVVFKSLSSLSTSTVVRPIIGPIAFDQSTRRTVSQYGGRYRALVIFRPSALL